ncbi:hypothetical protein EV426DRAFT_703434 [Tirmania nivea]|nr:hypothetical protein EV426DRAFT_703434 [Tirmania nivea]
MSKNSTLIEVVGKVVWRSMGLRERYFEEMQKLNGAAKWELVARLTSAHMEKVAFAAQAMKVDRANVETDLNFSMVILPIMTVHGQSEKRKVKAKERLLTPRELTVYAKKHTDWDAADKDLMDRVQKRLATKRTKKYLYLMSRDITDRNLLEKRRVHGRKSVVGTQSTELHGIGEYTTSREVPAGQVAVAKIEVAAPSSVKEAGAAGPSKKRKRILRRQPDAFEDHPAHSDQMLELTTSPVNSEPECPEHHDSNIDLDNFTKIQELYGELEQTDDLQEPENDSDVEPVQLVNWGKRGNEGVEELKRKVEDDEEKGDALAVKDTMRILMDGEGRQSYELAKQWLKMLTMAQIQ